MAGANIDYKNFIASKEKLLKEILNLIISATTGDYPAGYKNPQICLKVDATAPQDDTAADFPNRIGDLCMHYNTSGVLQGIYIAKGGDLSSTCNWVQIA